MTFTVQSKLNGMLLEFPYIWLRTVIRTKKQQLQGSTDARKSTIRMK